MPKPKPGTGKKICKACGATCGAAVKVCAGCQAAFKGKDKVKAEQNATAKNKKPIFPEEYSGYRILSTIYVPAGDCPLKLKKDPTQEDLEEWAESLRFLFIEKCNAWLLNHALCYYLRYQYEFNDKKYQKLEEMVMKLKDVEFKVATPPQEN